MHLNIKQGVAPGETLSLGSFRGCEVFRIFFHLFGDHLLIFSFYGLLFIDGCFLRTDLIELAGWVMKRQLLALLRVDISIQPDFPHPPFPYLFFFMQFKTNFDDSASV